MLLLNFKRYPSDFSALSQKELLSSRMSVFICIVVSINSSSIVFSLKFLLMTSDGQKFESNAINIEGLTEAKKTTNDGYCGNIGIFFKKRGTRIKNFRVRYETFTNIWEWVGYIILNTDIPWIIFGSHSSGMSINNHFIYW